MKLLAAVAIIATTAWADTVRVPGGHVVPRECITQVPNGAVHDKAAAPPASSRCNAKEIASPEVQIYAADVHFKSKEPLTSFTADWVVPPKPSKSRGQVVYFWPGFKASAPEMGYPVLQPVLQFGEYGANWELQSWFVDANDHHYPVVTAPAIDVLPGHRITSYMSQSDDRTTWTVSGHNVDTGRNSTLSIAYAKAGDVDYDYAMLVNENINVNTECSLMPASTNVTFTSVSINGEPVPPWTTRADCAGNPQCDCGNDAAVDEMGNVILSWRPA